MDVNGQLCAPAALLPAPRYSLHWELGAGLDALEKKKSLFPLTGIEPRFLSLLISFLVWHNIPMWFKASRFLRFRNPIYRYLLKLLGQGDRPVARPYQYTTT
jgi:hypothetical protein